MWPDDFAAIFDRVLDPVLAVFRRQFDSLDNARWSNGSSFPNMTKLSMNIEGRSANCFKFGGFSIEQRETIKALGELRQREGPTECFWNIRQENSHVDGEAIGEHGCLAGFDCLERHAKQLARGFPAGETIGLATFPCELALGEFGQLGLQLALSIDGICAEDGGIMLRREIK